MSESFAVPSRRSFSTSPPEKERRNKASVSNSVDGQRIRGREFVHKLMSPRSPGSFSDGPSTTRTRKHSRTLSLDCHQPMGRQAPVMIKPALGEQTGRRIAPQQLRRFRNKAVASRAVTNNTKRRERAERRKTSPEFGRSVLQRNKGYADLGKFATPRKSRTAQQQCQLAGSSASAVAYSNQSDDAGGRVLDDILQQLDFKLLQVQSASGGPEALIKGASGPTE